MLFVLMLRGGDGGEDMFVVRLGLWWCEVELRLYLRNRSAGSGREKVEDALLLGSE